ncbi:zf-HC2 domain-containing protein [Gordonia crocea]|uniref:zf-HC2 domain-containing protein n=1 Tax=Gordonia crocea TaxID=589162 RepID=UPI001E47E0B7|nr:zf-HC2 domain-containing protein [Gordonia crocea]
MQCEVARESLSARVDGEREMVPAAQVDEHLAGCRECARWYEAVCSFDLFSPDVAPDLSGQIMADLRNRSRAPEHRAAQSLWGNVMRSPAGLPTATVAATIATLMWSFGYLLRDLPTWYPAIHGALATATLVLVSALLVCRWRNLRDHRKASADRRFARAADEAPESAEVVQLRPPRPDPAPRRGPRALG